MSFRITNETLSAQIRDLTERLRKIESGSPNGSKWSQTCSTFGCVTLISPKSDFGLGGNALEVKYEITPIWPGQAGYPGVKFTRTQTDTVTGATTVTTSTTTV